MSRENKKKKSILAYVCPVLSVVVVCACSNALAAAPWEYGVEINIGLINTDNVFLADDGLEESDTVATVAPEFFLRSDGDRISANINYRPEAYFYDTNSTADTVYHVVDATITTTLIRERLTVDWRASNTQSILTPEGQFPTTNIPITVNRVDTRVLEVRPAWRQRIGSADFNLNLNYMDLSYDDMLSQDSTGKTGGIGLNNIDRRQGLAWGGRYDHYRIEYDLSPPWEYQRAEATIGYWFGGTKRLFASGGAETDPDRIDDANLDENFWEVGIQYVPSQRLNLEAAIGTRSYGTSFRANIAYTMRRGQTQFTYIEGPATSAQIPAGRQPIIQTDNFDSALDQPGRADRFIQRRLDWNTGITLAKSELTVRLFNERRENRTVPGGVPLDDLDYSGIAVRLSWRAGTRTTFGVGTDFTRRDDANRKSDILRAQVDAAYQFSRRFSLRGEIASSRQEGRESNEFDYTENQYRLFLRTEF